MTQSYWHMFFIFRAILIWPRHYYSRLCGAHIIAYPTSQEAGSLAGIKFYNGLFIRDGLDLIACRQP
jgi:hypothetical protein